MSIKRLLGLADREIKRLYDAGRSALCAAPAGRAAEQPSVLRRACHQRRAARSRRCARRSGSTSCCRSTSQRRAGTREPLRALRQADADGGRGDPRRPGQGQGRARYLRAPRRRQPDELDAAGRACCARSATRSACWASASCAHACRARPRGSKRMVARARPPPDHAALVHIAATLISVEDRLDDELIGLIVPRRRERRRQPALGRCRFPAGAGRGAARMQSSTSRA